MKKILMAFLLIISNLSYSADIIISDIHFSGFQRISSDTALLNVSLKIGDTIDSNNIASSIRTLFAMGYFDEISISNNNKGIILIKVKERSIINNIVFSGNKKISEDVITKVLNLKKIQLGEPLNNCCIIEAQHELQDMYYNIGRFNATVKIITIFLPRNRVDLKIMITEGEVAKIKQINIVGNNIFHTKKLLSQFTLYNKITWWNILSTKQYQTQKLFHDLESLKNFYLNRGYAKFSIDSTQINVTPDKKNIYFSLYITEGIQYSFSNLTFHGNILDIVPNIKKYIYIRPGELYSNNKIKEIEHKIQYVLGEYGYITPDISIDPYIDEINKTIKLYVYVDVGNRYYVREIFFEGNNLTKDSVIRREIHQIEKAPLNCVYIFKDQERLKRLGYFKNINTNIKYLPNLANQVDIAYQLEECNTGNLNLSVGIGTESGVNLQFGMYQENLLGTGNSISIAGTKNYYQTYAEISTIMRSYYNFDKINAGGKIFYNKINTNYTDLSNYNLKNYGTSLNYSYSFIENHTFSLGLNYISNCLSKITPQVAIWRYLKSVNINPELFFNKSLIDNINFSTNDIMFLSGWTFSNLNHSYFPTSGLYLNISSKVTLPGSNNQYYKITFDGNYYTSLDQFYNWILMNSIYIGYAGSIHKKENPFYDNFYAGGINTIRGFRLNSIGPKAVYYYCINQNTNYDKCSVKSSQDSVGGNAINLIKTELIVPIIYFDKQYADTIRISIFIDAGTVWDTFWKNTEVTRIAGIPDYSIAYNIRVSNGVSLKWMSPIGPIIFSYAKLIKKYVGDIEEPFQFSIGKTW